MSYFYKKLTIISSIYFNNFLMGGSGRFRPEASCSNALHVPFYPRLFSFAIFRLVNFAIVSSINRFDGGPGKDTRYASLGISYWHRTCSRRNIGTWRTIFYTRATSASYRVRPFLRCAYVPSKFQFPLSILSW